MAEKRRLVFTFSLAYFGVRIGQNICSFISVASRGIIVWF